MNFKEEPVAHIIFQIIQIPFLSELCYASRRSIKTNVKGDFFNENENFYLGLVTMEIYFTIKPIRLLNIFGLLWQHLRDLQWLLAEVTRIQLKLKYWICQAIRGLKLRIIHIILDSKFFIFSES